MGNIIYIYMLVGVLFFNTLWLKGNVYFEGQIMTVTKIQICPSRCKTLVVGDVSYRSAYDWSVTQQDMDKARRELKENDNDREGSILELRKRLEKDSKLLHQVDDHYLLCYLRFRKFNIDQAYNTIRNAHSVRIKRPELFSLPPNLEQKYDINIFNWLPYRDAEGSLIVWNKFGNWNPEQVSFYEVVQLGCGMEDLMTMNPACQINGFIAIWDFRGSNLKARHLTPLMNPRFLWLFCSLWKDCYPERFKLILMINCNKVVKALFNATTYFLKSKLKDRIKLLGSDVSEIHQYVNPVLLPKDLGGEIEDCECAITGHVMGNLPYLRHMRSLGDDTSDCRAPDENLS